MIYLKTNPIGIDKKIQDLQQVLYNQLISLWGLAEQQYNCYGRSYRNQDKTGYVPEVFAEKKEYDDPLLNDKIAVTSFFGVGGSSKYDAGRRIAKVHLIFSLNLNQVKPDLVHRGDEEVQMDILQVLKDHGYLYNDIEGTEQWMDYVYREYSSVRTNDRLKFGDMHPFHHFRINMTMIYPGTNCV